MLPACACGRAVAARDCRQCGHACRETGQTRQCAHSSRQHHDHVPRARANGRGRAPECWRPCLPAYAVCSRFPGGLCHHHPCGGPCSMRSGDGAEHSVREAARAPAAWHSRSSLLHFLGGRCWCKDGAPWLSGGASHAGSGRDHAGSSDHDDPDDGCSLARRRAHRCHLSAPLTLRMAAAAAAGPSIAAAAAATEQPRWQRRVPHGSARHSYLGNADAAR